MSLEKKLNNLMTTYKKQINDLSRESKIVSGQRFNLFMILVGGFMIIACGSKKL